MSTQVYKEAMEILSKLSDKVDEAIRKLES